jgi:hypothetical protein
VWAALTANAEGDSRPWLLCVLETFTMPIPANEKQAQQRLAKRCELDIRYITV